MVTAPRRGVTRVAWPSRLFSRPSDRCRVLAGAVFGIWQARAFPGAQIVNEPGAMVWNEQLSHDLEASKPAAWQQEQCQCLVDT
jgi:hypothetical protein